MSTFLVSFGVVAATIAAVLYVALSGPDQPPTIRRQPPGARRERKRAEAAEKAAARAARAGRRADAEAPGETAPPGRAAPAPVVAPVAAAATGGPFSATPPQGAPALALPDSDAMRLRVLPAQPTTLWVRVRSGVALVVLVAVLGALLAMVVGAVIIGLAFLIRSATG